MGPHIGHCTALPIAQAEGPGGRGGARRGATAAAAVGPGEGGGGEGGRPPPPKKISSINNKNEQGNPNSEKNQKTQIRQVCYHVFLYEEVKMILWSIHTLWYKGSAENKYKSQVRQKDTLSQK